MTRRPRPPGTADRPHPAPEDDLTQRVLAMVMHELASPLVVIEGFADALTTDVSSLKPESAKALDAIKRAAEQIQDVLERIADAGRVDTGALDLTRTRVDLDTLVREVAKDLAPEIEPRPLTVEADAEVVVQADEQRIHQVFTDLLTNAAKYSPATSAILITISAHPGAVEVAISDRCVGIPPEARANLFRKFTRIRKAAGGMGLGLYISRGIARAHGGDLTFEAPSEGGCRFVLRLPR